MSRTFGGLSVEFSMLEGELLCEGRRIEGRFHDGRAGEISAMSFGRRSRNTFPSPSGRKGDEEDLPQTRDRYRTGFSTFYAQAVSGKYFTASIARAVRRTAIFRAEPPNGYSERCGHTACMSLTI
jgi:hypothetical protein